MNRYSVSISITSARTEFALSAHGYTESSVRVCTIIEEFDVIWLFVWQECVSVILNQGMMNTLSNT